MTRIALDQDVRAVAAQLGVPLRSDPTGLIVDRCIQKIASWCDALGPVETLEELVDIVCEKLRLRFEVIATDRDLNRIKQRYLKTEELAFADLDREFNATTDAVVIRLRHAPAWSNVWYVAVVDGRGNKQHRVWFSKWHEIAHLLAEPQTKFIYRRTQAFKREPVERLMDQIAAALAFYEPLFLPSLKANGLLAKRPHLSSLTTYARTHHPYASLQTTLCAILKYVDQPIILIEAKPALKVGEKNGPRRLRAVTTTHNPAALRSRTFLHRNIRVPERSVIFRVFEGHRALENRRTTECLSWWESGGEHLPARSVAIDAMRAGAERVLALCSFN